MSENPLSQLQSIHTPDAVSAWPLAWGWWLLLAVFAALSVLLVVSVYRHIRFNKARRQAILAASRLDIHSGNMASQLNELLKRLCLHYGDPSVVAKMNGEPWVTYLLGAVKTGVADTLRSDLSTMQGFLYAPVSVSSTQNKQFQQAVMTWMKKADMSALNKNSFAGSITRV